MRSLHAFREMNDFESLHFFFALQPFLPSIFSEEDCHLLLQECVKKQTDAIICCDTIVTSQKYISKWKQPFASLVQKKAEKVTMSIKEALTDRCKRRNSCKLVVQNEFFFIIQIHCSVNTVHLGFGLCTNLVVVAVLR